MSGVTYMESRTIEWRELFRRDGLLAGSWTCSCSDPAPGAVEWAPRHEIVFVRRGAFVRHVAGRTAHADANHVLFFRAAQEYRISHPVPGGDLCTVFAVDDSTLSHLLVSAVGGSTWRDGQLPDSNWPIDSRTFLAHRRLVSLLANGTPQDELALEEVSLSLLQRALAFPCGGPLDREPRWCGTDPRHRRAVADVQEFLAARYGDSSSLEEIAAAASYSKYHLCRIFRDTAGLTIHRYRNRLRLRAALERLTDPGVDLSAVAFAVGFSSHSHFSDAFRREFGIPPSKARRTLQSVDLNRLAVRLFLPEL